MEIIEQSANTITTDAARQKYSILETNANIDTLELFCRSLPHGIRRQLQTLQGKRVRIRRADKWGWVSCVNQPNCEVLHYLATRMDALWKCGPDVCHLSIHRVDIGVEFLTAEPEYGNELQWYLERHVVLKWNRRLGVRDAYGTSYWNEARSPRNIVAYSDKQSRMVSGECGCCRLEIRLLRTALIRYKLTEIGSIVAINLQMLFQKQMMGRLR